MPNSRDFALKLAERFGTLLAEPVEFRGEITLKVLDAEKIAGARSSDIEALLGYTAGATLIHADDLALSR